MILYLQYYLMITAVFEAPNTAGEQSWESVVVGHPATETAWIIAALTPLERESGNSVDRTSIYFKSVEDWFQPCRNHNAVTALGSKFNLPRFVGNAARYELRGGHLSADSSQQSLWDDANGDLFERHKAEIEDFIRECRVQEFLDAHALEYASLESRSRSGADVEDMIKWLETQFTVRPTPPVILISPLTARHHWTGQMGGRTHIWVVAPEVDPQISSEIASLTFERRIFTELDHNYVNPASALVSQSIGEAMSSRTVWVRDDITDYGTPEAVFNEYMTFAAFLEYLRDRLPEDQYERGRRMVVAQMVERRGFLQFEGFAAALTEYRRHSGATIQATYPEIISWAARRNRQDG